MNKSESIKELATALSKAQSQLHGAKKDAANPFFKSSFATLESVWDTIRDPFTKNGLSVVQSSLVTNEGGMILITMLLHSSGEFITAEYPIRTADDKPQSLGSGLSYARRYSLMAICGVTPSDDDGEAAMGRPPSSYSPPAATKPRTTMPPMVPANRL